MNTLEHLFSWVLAASWQASLLAILVLAVQAALGRRLNPRWRHALWLLVLLRLILPTLPESNLSLYRFAPAEPPLHRAAARAGDRPAHPGLDHPRPARDPRSPDRLRLAHAHPPLAHRRQRPRAAYARGQPPLRPPRRPRAANH